jgi:O-antigen/teichoic acid export membrane protein
MLRDVATTGLGISKKTRVIATIVVLTALMNLFLNYILIGWLGNLGAALSKMLSMFVFFVLTLYFAQRVYPIPYEIRRITLMLIVGAGLYGISILFNSFDLIPRMFIKLALVLSYPFVLHLFRFYEPMEIERLKSGWSKWRDPNEISRNIKRLIK